MINNQRSAISDQCPGVWTGHCPLNTAHCFLISCPMPPPPDAIHEQGLHHQLTAGQMTMVAVGGSIGTGLLLGSAAALEVAGPGVIISYLIAAFIAYTVAMALGELATMHPAAGSFGLYGELYLNQYIGFLCRAGYWATIAFSVG